MLKGLGPDFVEAVGLNAPSTELVKKGLFLKSGEVLFSLIQFAPPALAALALIALCLYLARTGKSMAGPVSGLALLLGAAGWLVLGTGPELPAHGTDQSYFWHFIKLPLMSFSVLLGLIVLVLSRVGPFAGRIKQDRRQGSALALFWGLGAVGIYALSTSAAQPHAGFNGVPTLLLSSLAGSWALLGQRERRPQKNRGRPEAVLLIALLVPLLTAFAAVRHSHDLTYRDGPATCLSTRSVLSGMAGIESSEKKMKGLDDLLTYLEGRVQPGDSFLAMYNLPLLYFLTRTRPAIIAAWTPQGWSGETYNRIYRKIGKQKRSPEYCVRYSPEVQSGTPPSTAERNPGKQEPEPRPAAGKAPPPGDSPHRAENEFLSRGYCLEKTIGVFQVWRRCRE